MDRSLCLTVGRTGTAPEARPEPGCGWHCLHQGPSLGAYSRAAGPGRIAKPDGLAYVLEGQIYSCTRAELESVLRQALGAETQEKALAAVRAFVAAADGEFLVAAEHEARGRGLVFNDSLGRLPLFSARLGAGLVLGRAVSAVRDLCHLSRPDRLGLAARLLFLYPLDARTEHEGIASFPESGIVWLAGPAAPPLVFTTDVSYGAGAGGEDRGAAHVPPAAVAELGERLAAACERRIRSLRDWIPTLALSGGFDSRLVACAVRKTGGAVEAVTRTDHLSIPMDAAVASQVAVALGISQYALPCGAVTPELVLDLIGVSDGGLGGGVAHMLGFLQRVREQLGAGRFLMTGDGGDKTIAPLLPPGRLTHSGEVARLLLAFSAAEESAGLALTGLSSADIHDYVDQSLRRQPGQSVPEKCRALLFRQRARRWLNLGEDRNRSVFWCTSPFYAPDFFHQANAIADEAKRRDKLYMRLLEWYSPKAARIPRPGNGSHGLWNWLMREGHLQMGRSIFLSRLYRRLKVRRPVPAMPGWLPPCLQEARRLGGGIWEVADPDLLLRQMENPPSARYRAQLVSLALANLAGQSRPPGP